MVVLWSGQTLQHRRTGTSTRSSRSLMPWNDWLAAPVDASLGSSGNILFLYCVAHQLLSAFDHSEATTCCYVAACRGCGTCTGIHQGSAILGIKVLFCSAVDCGCCPVCCDVRCSLWGLHYPLRRCCGHADNWHLCVRAVLCLCKRSRATFTMSTQMRTMTLIPHEPRWLPTGC